ncbi:DUF4396 domain-containing protein [Rhizobium jaguaris]|uniref:DUF4396 domain-containing protein n=1 Tax=Rhizobium jaguaris TaxID=1312183 RepID=UPI001FDF908C|nr:DUF4396 domain-containing protein [Rhizobium jaguaris]
MAEAKTQSEEIPRSKMTPFAAMAAIQLFIFPAASGEKAGVNSWEFWFAAQIALICVFVTSFPINWYLISSGLKEKL